MNNNKTTISGELLESAQADIAAVLQKFAYRNEWLDRKRGPVTLQTIRVKRDRARKSTSAFMRLIANVRNPLVILQMFLGVVSYLPGDMRATIMIFAMGRE